MKLIRQISLVLREGSTDRLYEVELCEVAPERFVVNFRFGKRGSALQEGSKTALPVSRPEADRIFDRLVTERKGKGYVEATVTPSEPASGAPVPAPLRVEEVADPRQQRLLALLRREQTGWTANVEKLVWRVGELRVEGAAPLLVQHAEKANDRLAWNLARAWLRIGDPSVVEQVRDLWTRKELAPWARSMAGHALRTLLEGEQRDDFLAEVEKRVDPIVLAALDNGQPGQAIAVLRKKPEMLDWAYLSCRESRRAGLLALFAAIPLEAAFLGVRRVWKAAEARADGEVFGLFARRFEIESPNRSYGRKAGFQAGTRKWLRRRVWRTLRRLGEARNYREFCAMAAGLLIAHTDADAREARRKVLGYDWRTRTETVVWTGRYTHLWALSNLLYRQAPQITINYGRLSMHLPGRMDDRARASRREEAFPEAWDASPEALATLLDLSRCDEVHFFAVRALRANRDSWGRIPVRRLIGWFAAPYPQTSELAAEVAITRYDPADPDLELVLALLSCPHEGPRNIATNWVKSNPGAFLSDVPFVTALVLNEQPTTRLLALELLSATPMLPDHAHQVLQAVLAAVRRVEPHDEAAQPKLRDVATVLMAAFARELSQWPLQEVAELIRHPTAGVAELGAKILLGHQIRPAELPDDLIAAAMTSVHPLVRGIGIRLYGELPDVVLAERFRVLVHLVTNPFPDVRTAVTPIVVRLASSNRAFAKVLFGALVPILTARGPEGMHRDVVRLLRTDLAGMLPVIEPAQVFRLLRAEETIVQELGGELLRTNVDPTSLTPSQLAVLASSDVAGVRRTALMMLGARVDAVRSDPECILPLLDARWEDSRQAAFAFVEQKVGFEHLPPEVAMAVCDSVRPDVQAFGRKIIVHAFDHAQGPRFLLRLAQHPSTPMQEFAASWLEQHASGNPERIERLRPFFLAVLLRPNQGRVAKVRVLAFLESQLQDRATAQVVASIAAELVLTAAKSHQARYVSMLNEIRRRHEGIAIPLQAIEPEVRGAV